MDRAELAAGLVIAGRYRVERLLGKGGMGAVYVVTHVHTEEKLALKVLHQAEMDPMALERFQREARAPARIDSDHVVRVTDADAAPELGGAPFLVMELLKGRDLESELRELGRFSPDQAIGFLRQAARALDKAHALGIVHRDLKPENLFVTRREDGTSFIKVLDFGIAKVSSVDVKAKTATGQVTGTPYYMAPEQVRGDNDNVGPRTDIWALGIIAHRLLTGRDLWTGTSLPQLVAQIAYEPMPVPSKLEGAPFDDAYDAWFARCCARDPKERYASASEAVEGLAAATGVATMPVRSVSQPSHKLAVIAAPGRRSSADGFARTETLGRQKPPLAFVLGMVGAAAVIGGVVVWLVMSPPKTSNETRTSAPAAVPPGPPPALESATTSAPPRATSETTSALATTTAASQAPSAGTASQAPSAGTASQAPSAGTASHAAAHKPPGPPPTTKPAASSSTRTDNDLLGAQH